jgi:protein-S-isoprenylcysteine O-methyltransferase Ste14
MFKVFKPHHGMNLVGQGGKIILFFMPALVVAILANIYYPSIAALPKGLSFLNVVGYIWLAPGVILWAAAVFQLLSEFYKGHLVTTGAYGVVRNPIYVSVAEFVLPAVSFITQTWVYFVPAIFLIAGVFIFIRKEERKLTEVFGEEYLNYCARVSRLIPFGRSLGSSKATARVE